jgi:hypothetical protein
LKSKLLNFVQRYFEIPLHVSGKRSQWRNVNDLNLVGEFSVDCLPKQLINGGEKGGERFTAAGRGSDEQITSILNQRPSAFLRFRRHTKAGLKPLLNDRVKRPE